MEYSLPIALNFFAFGLTFATLDLALVELTFNALLLCTVCDRPLSVCGAPGTLGGLDDVSCIPYGSRDCR